jgi:hypothetical protein
MIGMNNIIYNQIQTQTHTQIPNQQVYHERQKGNYCRCHALNNLFGFQLVSLQEFDNYCDEFDKLNNFERGSSRGRHMFYNNGSTDNLFGYILDKKGYKVKMEHYDYYTTLSREIVNTIDKNKNNSEFYGLIVYNRNHTYCIRNYNNEYLLIDSMKAYPQKQQDLHHISQKGIGSIAVYKK